MAVLEKLRNAKAWFTAKPIRLVWLAFGVYVLVFTSATWFKYSQLGYNGLDLAIYQQVFWNTAHGRWFQYSIHPGQLYLGDHLELGILLLLPLYWLWQSPLNLLLLQTVALGATAFPVYRIARWVFRGADDGIPTGVQQGAQRAAPLQTGLGRQMETWSVVAASLWLANPLLHNINLFEFHLLAFAPLALLWLIAFYLERRWWPFVTALLIALTIREDVPLAIIGLGLYAAWEWWRARLRPPLAKGGDGGVVVGAPADLGAAPRPRGAPTRRWVITPLTLGIAWLAFSVWLTGRFNADGQYKFLAYYGWLGGNMREVLRNALLKPWLIIQHLFTGQVGVFLVALPLAFLYLPLLAPAALLISLPALAQLLLGGSTNALVILNSHYTALLLPGLLLAALQGWIKLRRWQSQYVERPPSAKGGRPALRSSERTRSEGGGDLPAATQKASGGRGNLNVLRIIASDRLALTIFLIAGTAYAALAFGPLPSIAQQLIRKPDERITLKKQLLAQVPDQAKVVATYDLQPPLATREKLVSAHYAYIGRTQFSASAYQLPADADLLLLDFDDFLSYQFQFQNNHFWSPYYKNGQRQFLEQLEANGFQLRLAVDTITVWGKGSSRDLRLMQRSPLERFNPPADPPLAKGGAWGGLRYLGSNALSLAKNQQAYAARLFSRQLHWQRVAEIERDPVLELQLVNAEGNIAYRQLYPFAYNLYPPSRWKPDEVVSVNYWFLLPEKLPTGDYQVRIQLLDATGYLALDGWRAVELRVGERKPLGEPIALGAFESR